MSVTFFFYATSTFHLHIYSNVHNVEGNLPFPRVSLPSSTERTHTLTLLMFTLNFTFRNRHVHNGLHTLGKQLYSILAWQGTIFFLDIPLTFVNSLTSVKRSRVFIVEKEQRRKKKKNVLCARNDRSGKFTRTSFQYKKKKGNLHWKLQQRRVTLSVEYSYECEHRVKESRKKRGRGKLDHSIEVATRAESHPEVSSRWREGRRRRKKRNERETAWQLSSGALLPTDSRTKRRIFATRSRCTSLPHPPPPLSIRCRYNVCAFTYVRVSSRVL